MREGSGTAVRPRGWRRGLGIVDGHRFVFSSALIGLLVWWILPHWLRTARPVLGWDAGGLVFLTLAAVLFAEAAPARMPADAERQQEGEWTIFVLVLLGVGFSFVAIVNEFADLKGKSPFARDLSMALVGITLALSWLLMQVIFALRYAHEYYQRKPSGDIDRGLDFPGGEAPDYWDFLYFAVVLGMTFQVSDVQITARKLRRLASVHGFLGFVFNTVIIALTVNLAAGLL